MATRDRRLAAADGPRDALDRLVRLYLPSSSSDLRWKLWAQLVARPPQDAETLGAYADVIDSWAAALVGVVNDGVAAGVFACDDPEELAYRACRLMDGYSLEVLLGSPTSFEIIEMDLRLLDITDDRVAPIGQLHLPTGAGRREQVGWPKNRGW